jgi:hypothetical protein
MRLDLEDLNPPVWFDHPDDDEARILMRETTNEEVTEIQRKTTKIRREFRRGQRFEYEEIDDDKRSEMMWSKAIVDWQGLYNGEEPIPCTDENKLLLMRKSPWFTRWVVDCLEKLMEDNAERIERAEKN